jgi:hypothetical protein
MSEPLPVRSIVQAALIVSLVAGGYSGNQALYALSALLAVASTLMEWPRLLPLARLFSTLAVVLGLMITAFLPQQLPQLWHALVQGVSFAALMMVLGMLRRPVRRSAFVRQGTEYLFTFEPRQRYAAVNIGSHLLSLLFNVGIIAMIGDLARAGGRDAVARRPLVLGAMRGAALTSIWSPIGLGFAIVTAGIPSLDPLKLMGISFALTAVMLLLTSAFPLLPAEASHGVSRPVVGEAPSARPLAITIGICGLLLSITITLHLVTGISFTLASVTVLPIFTLIWLALETGVGPAYVAEVKGAVVGLGDLRSESTIFLSANVIGAAISIALGAIPGWVDFVQSQVPVLPLLLTALILIPVAAACFIPNSIFVVILAQLLGQSPIGNAHPLALGVTLSVAWASAVAVSPISAMSLVTASQSDVSPQRVAWRWNTAFTTIVLVVTIIAICGLMWLGL